MDRFNFYCEMMYIVNELYHLNEKDYDRTMRELKRMNENKKVHMEEFIYLLKYVRNIHRLNEKKMVKIKEINEELVIKNPIENEMYLNKSIKIFSKNFNGVRLDFDLLMVVVIPSLIININDKIDIYDFNGDLGINKRILNIVKDINLNEDVCSICLEKFDISNDIIMSCCCCDKTCKRCYNLNNTCCAICKGDKSIIINLKND